MQRILSQKDEIRNLSNIGTPQTLKRKRQMVYSDIDQHVLEWYKSAKKKKIPISGPRLQGNSKTLFTKKYSLITINFQPKL